MPTISRLPIVCPALSMTPPAPRPVAAAREAAAVTPAAAARAVDSGPAPRQLAYDWVLFDADDTLFHFDSFAGLRQMFAGFGVAFDAADFADYQAVNKPLWVAYQRGEITAQQLCEQRFQSWADRLDTTPRRLNQAFLAAMAKVCTPLPGAVELVRALHGKAKLGIITNGFTDLHRARLDYNGMSQYFDLLVVSEEVGMAKPHRGIFEHALAKMGRPDRSRVLMVGDNPDADVAGGVQAGIHTCWLNVAKHDAAWAPTMTVGALRELQDRLLPSGS